MPRKPKNDVPSNDRHKDGKQVRIRGRLVAQAMILAARLEHDLTQIVNDAVREKLEREKLWPPSSQDPTATEQ